MGRVSRYFKEAAAFARGSLLCWLIAERGSRAYGSSCAATTVETCSPAFSHDPHPIKRRRGARAAWHTVADLLSVRRLPARASRLISRDFLSLLVTLYDRCVVR
jgi:hypothetical protein